MHAWSRGSSGFSTSRSAWIGASATTTRNRRVRPGSTPATRAKDLRTSSTASRRAEPSAAALTVLPGLVPGIHVDPRDEPGGDEVDFGKVHHDDFFGEGIEHCTAQLPAIAVVAGLAGGAGIDHQHTADALHQLVVRVAVQYEIGFGLAKSLQQRAMRVDIGALRLPGCRMDGEQLLAADVELDPLRPLGEPPQQ